MAKELITRIWCDACAADDAHTEADTEQFVSLKLGGAPYIIDLCLKHVDALVTPLEELALSAGRPVDLQAAAPKRKYTRRSSGSNYDATRGVFACKVEGCGTVTVLRGSLRKHAANVHGLSLGDYEATFGPIESTGDPMMLPIACPDCSERFGASSSLGIHRKRVHR